MKKTVVVLAHPSIERRSLANKIIIEKIKTLEGVKIKYFYSEYPTFKFNIEAELAATTTSRLTIF